MSGTQQMVIYRQPHWRGSVSNRNIFILSALLMVIVVLFNFSVKKQPEQGEIETILNVFEMPPLIQGRVTSAFQIELMNGETFSFYENIGQKVIILNFFSTWSRQCKEELPELNRFFQMHKHEPLVFIGIYGKEREDKVSDFIEKYDITFPVGRDEDGHLHEMFAVVNYPTTILINAKGIIRLYQAGPILNADVTFDSHNDYKENINLIREGKGITKEMYLKSLKAQEYADRANRPKDYKE